jgi:cysteinyl-tRNA synthetase
MTIRLFNTLSKQKEDFVPTTTGRVGMYLCGPTVYSDAHLGHGKTAVAFDVIRRWFAYRGFKVRFVSNITDVGHITDETSDEGHDRIGERAKLEQLEPMEVAEKYMWNYFHDMEQLNVQKPNIAPRATGHILEQIEMVQTLIAKGKAYERDGSVYFRVRADPNYGKLSGRKIDELEVGTREDVREDKEDPLDFALWKFAEPEHLMRWKSPWGEGFPGWHIECSAMAIKYLGEGFDIHAGGLDLQFPHHEAEIAQAEGAGYQFARYWMHGNMLTINGEKMSKSKGNFTTLQDFYATHDPMVLRLIYIQSHYRSVAELSADTITAATSVLSRFRETRRELVRKLENATPGQDAAFEKKINFEKDQFETAMDDDFNTPEALAALFAMTKEFNAVAITNNKNSLEMALEIFDQLAGFVFGLFPANTSQATQGKEGLLEGLLEIAIEARKSYRLNRDFKSSDALRERLKSLGVQLEDTVDGTRWKLEG